MITIQSFATLKKNAQNKGGFTKTTTNTINTITNVTGGVEGVRIWGQYHDHTADITGDMSGVGNINASGTITSNSVTTGNINSSGNLITNNITANGTINSTGNITTNAALYANDAYITNELVTNSIAAALGEITTLLSTDITCENLTVTKAAHFFKLIIDEIKATKGQILVTPANATIDKVTHPSTNRYILYFRANDADGREIFNTFEVNDQILCQTFNAATGTSYNVSNKFYWAKCVAVSSQPTNQTIDGQSVPCHSITLDWTDKDTSTNGVPEAGDEIVMLGNRTDTTRQAAISIGAYNNPYLDSGISAPFIIQYNGVNDYNLSAHRGNVISNGYNSFKGIFTTTTGDNIEDLIDDASAGALTYMHIAYANSSNGQTNFSKTYFTNATYIGFCSNHTQSDAQLTYQDYTWCRLRGENGTNANGYVLMSDSLSVHVDKLGDVVEDDFYVRGYNFQNGVKTEVNNVCRYTYIYEDSSQNVSYTSALPIQIQPTSDQQLIDNDLKKYRFEMLGTNNNVLSQLEVPIIRDGADGDADAMEEYKLIPVIERVPIDANGTVGVQLQYNIMHLVGSNFDYANATSSMCVYFRPHYQTTTGTYTALSINTQTPSYTNAQYQTNYNTSNNKLLYIDVVLANATPTTTGVKIYDKRQVYAAMLPSATFEITDSIKSTVQGHTAQLSTIDNSITSITNSISTIEQNYDEISSTVEAHTTSISSLNGRVTTNEGNLTDLDDRVTNNTTNITNITQSYNQISSTVQTHTNQISSLDGRISAQTSQISTISQKADAIESTVQTLKTGAENYFNFTYCRWQNVIPFIKAYGVECTSSLSRISNLGFEGIGGDFCVTCSMKMRNTAAGINVNLCDVNDADQQTVNVTTTWQRFTFHFKNITNYIDPINSFNGFIDFEGSSITSTNRLYVKDLMITRGNVPSEFNVSWKDLENANTDPILQWQYDTRIQPTNTSYKGYNVYSPTQYNTEEGHYIDYIFYNNKQLKTNTVYTLSFWAKADTACKISQFFYGNGGCVDGTATSVNILQQAGDITISNATDGMTQCYVGTTWKQFVIHWYNMNSGNRSIICYRDNVENWSNYDASTWSQQTTHTTPNLSIAGMEFREGYWEKELLNNQSLIRQTANDIEMSVNNISLRLDGISSEIELNGDTKINGSLTMNDTTQGFLLTNGNNTTQISPQSIGTYADFQSRTNNLIHVSQNNTKELTDLSSYYQTTLEYTYSMGTIPNNTLVTVKNYSATPFYANSVRGHFLVSPTYYSGVVRIYQGSTQKASTTITSSSATTVCNATTTASEEVKVTIALTVRFSKTAIDNIYASASALEIPNVTGYVQYEIQLPTTSFMLIGYDGLAVNFGNNKTAYIGSDSTTIQYGNYGIRISTSGLQKYNGSTWVSL